MDGTKNKQGAIHFYTGLDIKISNQMFHKKFYIPGLGSQKVILGFPWLRMHNLEINWKKGMITWRNTEWSKTLVKEWQLKRESIKKEQQPTMEEEDDLESIKNHSLNLLVDMEAILLEFMNVEDKVWINTKTNMATSLAAEANLKKPKLSSEQLVPEKYHEYLDIFDENKANQYPEP